MKYVLIGAGARGMIYSSWAVNNGIEIAAIAEPRADRLLSAAAQLNVPAEMCFSTAEELFAQGRIADAAIVATMDKDHYGHVMAALDCGYDILLEKPISPSIQECIEIEEKANALGKKITVCHVLRYTNFFSTLKSILDSGELGKIVSIKHAENIGNWHMAHSFVRGNWRNSQTSCPIIMAKSCHDMDILLWLVGKHCTKVAAFGSLSFFREENAPEGSTDRCNTCPLADTCRYSAWKAYQPALGGWPANVVCLEQTEEALKEALKTSPYGRCVFRCDNDVCDHMSTIMEFEDGITATFTLTAQSHKMGRDIHIMCEHGEIIADDKANKVIVTHFGPNGVESYDSRMITILNNGSGHGGGDAGIMQDFTASISGGSTETRSSISRSVESHLMAHAMEESRVTGQVIDMAKFRASLKK